jgi:hypothetical protein
MHKPRKIDVAFADGHWLAEVGPDHGAFDCRSLTLLVKAVQVLVAEPLIFVVDYLTIEYHIDAKVQLFEASKTSGALVISSAQEF